MFLKDKEMRIGMAEQRIYSILGDSLSTFEGYTPAGYDFYDRFTGSETGIKSVEDTWWMQVILAEGGTLGYNNSISGSTVAGDVSLSGTSAARLKSLAINGIPDVIFLYMGGNDWAYSVLPEEFEDAYRRTIASLIRLYPDAEIYCATLMRGKEIDDPRLNFFNIDGCVSPRIYSRIIRDCAEKAGVKVVDLERYGTEYATIDGIHPNKEGMKTIAEHWIKELSRSR